MRIYRGGSHSSRALPNPSPSQASQSRSSTEDPRTRAGRGQTRGAGNDRSIEEESGVIGKTVWRFDRNHRVYDKGKITGPIYREHWVPIVIFGETSRSWLAGYEFDPYKIPKKGPHHPFALSEQEVEDDCWRQEHRYSISRQVERVTDVEILRKIAALVGWSPG